MTVLKLLDEIPSDYQIVDKRETQAHRNKLIDLIRIFAAFGVITAHVHTDTPNALMFTNFFGSVRVPFLFVTSLALFVSNLSKNNSIEYTIVKSWKRLGIPFVTWSIIYASLINAKAILTNKPIDYSFIKVFLYGLSSEQMYYLPELIIMQVVLFGTWLLVRNVNQNRGLLLLVIAASYLCWGYYNHYYGVQPFGAIVAYIIAAFYLAPRIKKCHETWSYFFIGLGLLLLAISKSFFTYPPVITNYLLVLPIGGVGLVLMTLHVSDFTIPKWALILASTTYGVYLSHVFFLELIEFIIERLHYDIFYNVPNKILMALLVFSVSVTFTLIIKKIPKARVFLLGEN